MARSVFFKSFLEVVVGIHIGKDHHLGSYLGHVLGLWGATEGIRGRDLQKADQLSGACQQAKEEMCSNVIK